MVLGFISLIIGIYLFLIGYLGVINSAWQQTVQFLIYVCSSLFFCTGFICITMAQIAKKIQNSKTIAEWLPANTIQKTEAAQTPQQENNAPKKTPKNVSDLFNDDEIMSKAQELRRMYGKEMYVEYLNGKAQELGLDGVSLTVDDVE